MSNAKITGETITTAMIDQMYELALANGDRKLLGDINIALQSPLDGVKPSDIDAAREAVAARWCVEFGGGS